MIQLTWVQLHVFGPLLNFPALLLIRNLRRPIILGDKVRCVLDFQALEGDVLDRAADEVVNPLDKQARPREHQVLLALIEAILRRTDLGAREQVVRKTVQHQRQGQA